jgi:beta-lactamase regulating signal transducer with metallopeptidase domain
VLNAAPRMSEQAEELTVSVPGSYSVQSDGRDLVRLSPPPESVVEEARQSGENWCGVGSAREILLAPVLRLVWLLGAAVMGAALLVSNLRFAARLRKTRRPLEADCPLPVWLTGEVETPCLFGLFRPAIYITPEAEADSVRCATPWSMS